MNQYNPNYWNAQYYPMAGYRQEPTPTPISIPPTSPIKLKEASVTYPTLTGAIRPGVSARLNLALRNAARSLIPDPDQYEDIISASSGYDLQVMKNHIMSITFKNYFYYRGAAHGMTLQTSVTANTQTGQIYQLRDLFNPQTNWKEQLTVIIRQQIRDRQIPLINPYPGVKGDEQFYLTEDSLVIYYPIYEYTPYYYGILEFKIPYTQITGIINPTGPIAQIMR